jgi:hypothetical protein
MAHMPLQRGFDGFTGFLPGMEDHWSALRWRDNVPYPNPNLTKTESYSATVYGEYALGTVIAHDPSVPLFLYLPWQCVHDPHQAPPAWPNQTSDAEVYRGMLWATDVYVGQLVDLLHTKAMYDNTLIVYSADNGGINGGNNYPLRGQKATNWEGGMRATAFVSGGLIPASLHGTTNNNRFHIVDWYPTFCRLAGVDGRDDAPVAPLPVDPSNPNKDVYQGNLSWPGVDGVDIWAMLINPTAYNTTSAHPTLVLTREVILAGQYKLVVGEVGAVHAGRGFGPWKSGWQTAQRANASDSNGYGYVPRLPRSELARFPSCLVNRCGVGDSVHK